MVAVSGFTSPAPAGACAGMSLHAALRDGLPETILVETLHIQMSATRSSYAAGDTVTVRVKVTRPAHRDPVGAGINFRPPAGVPAPRVHVGVGLSVGRSFVYAGGSTDAVGRETLKLRLPGGAPAGPVTARALAYKRHVETICANVDEVGFARDARLFTIR
jgi:hypothetical protein